MLSQVFTKERKQIILDRAVKFLMDTVLTQIFAYFVIFSVCGSIPQVSAAYSADILFKYTLYFSLVWNILLSSTAISILTITALFGSVIGAVVYYAADPHFHSWINGYFQWISTLFWKFNAPNEEFEYVTVILITVFFTLLMTFFATRFSNVGLVLFIIIPFSVYYELAGNSLGIGYFPTLIFGLAVYYMRLRQSIYLDYRLSERYSVRFGRMVNVVMLPGLVIALLLTKLVTALPEDRYAASEANLGLSARLTELVMRTEENLFSTTRDIVYESDRIGQNDGEGVIFNSSRVHTLTVSSYSPTVEYFYLRSYAYRNFDGSWTRKASSPVEMPNNGAPSGIAMDEASAAMHLITNRALNSYASTVPSGIASTEHTIQKNMDKADISITYEDIQARTFFEVPMVRSYSLLGKNKLTVLDDFNGTGLYADEGVPSDTTYTANYIHLRKNADSIAFYRYFGRGFYDAITEKEETSVYDNNLERYRSYAERIRLSYTDASGAGDKLSTLARRLYDPDKGDYENALIIADYLTKHCDYDAHTYLGRDGSLNLDQFLFSNKKGNDVHFATAAVMMLRAAGIPARYAEGYLVAAGGNLGEVEVRQKDEHAWAELYLEGLGWVPLETVPGKGEPATDILRADYGEDEVEETTSFFRELTLREIGEAALNLLKLAAAAILRVVLGLAAAAAFILFLLWLRSFVKRQMALRDESRESMEKMLKILFKAASAAGIKRGRGEGMREYAERIDDLLPQDSRLAPMVDAAYAVRYGRESVPDDRENELRFILENYGDYLRALKKGFRMQVIGRLIG